MIGADDVPRQYKKDQHCHLPGRDKVVQKGRKVAVVKDFVMIYDMKEDNYQCGTPPENF
jgi:hypothetical protein